ncbi:MAG: gas vesicle synthesis GvpLGvpF [Nitrospirae bacterium CG_4_10_14_0_8_um_filter_41_23]|nr:MAG: gas vesicle synthesis GvpLGvpF [Nitrospirae bacterium CG_4_10_14_0_8_um_filter_41_23]
MEREGKYIYCIIESNEAQSFGPSGIGGRGNELHTVCFNDIAAVVSDSPIKKYPVSRENLIPHEHAIEEVMKTHTVLPVRFCTIAEDEAKVKRILEKEYDKFKNLLKGIQGKRELGLKVVLKEDVIYKDILEKYKDIKALKEKIATLPSEKTYFQRAKIGEMVEAALEKEKEIYREDILETLSPLALEVKTNNTYGERMIVNAAFLVERHKEAEFDQRVQELDATYGDKMKFKYVGTLPPFNFINLTINVGEY